MIVAAARTPIGRAGKGSLVDVRPDDLAAGVIRAALDQVPALDPADLDDLYLGCAEPRDEQGGNVARRVGVLLGLDVACRRPRSTGSVRPACRPRGWRSTPSRSARVTPSCRPASSPSPATATSVAPGWTGPRATTRRSSTPSNARRRTRPATRPGTTRGRTGDCPTSTSRWARRRRTSPPAGITRAEQDEFGVRSQNRAERAIASGFFAAETPVTRPTGCVSTDDGPRPGTTLDAVAALKPAFRPDGTVTAGNCCPLNDGAGGGDHE